jgi:hypothetical protein|tara:strand:+ start:841 stop:1044 length:204 start_codon:yes stop_codon:yes gene_type:complete
MELTASSPNRRLEMKHRIEDYTDRDLLAAWQSPHVPQYMKEEIMLEKHMRDTELKRELEQVRIHNLT